MENKTVSDELFTDGGGDLIAEGEALEESAKRADAEEGTKRRRRGDKLKKRSFRADIPFYLLLLPALVIVILFKYLPMTGLLLAFKIGTQNSGCSAAPGRTITASGISFAFLRRPNSCNRSSTRCISML